MADIFDLATEREERSRNESLAAQAAIAASTPKAEPRGRCLNPLCGEPFHPDEYMRLFCGRDCADEHARRTKKHF